MDIHKPKPWHGWREFLKEYLIIVVGVLTALGAEAVVERLHWRHQTELAHEALAYDMKRVTGWAGLVDAQSPCLGARLTELDAILDKAQDSGRFPPLGPLAKPIASAWNLRAWSGLTYGQTLAHMPNPEQTRLAGLARLVDWMSASDAETTDHWARLQRMSGLGRRTNDAEIAALRELVAAERGLAAKRRGGARLAESFVVQTGLLTKAEIDRSWKQGLSEAAAANICKPIPPVSQLDLIGGNLRSPANPPDRGNPDDVGVRGETLK
jgi:hypothetical protein